VRLRDSPDARLRQPDSIAFILGDSEASLLVAASDTKWQAIARVGAILPALRQVVVLRRELTRSETNGPPVLTSEEWIASAGTRAGQATGQRPGPHDLAAIASTSGTTGKPKGVMLTHDNVLSNIKSAVPRVTVDSHDLFLSFLPRSHTLERTRGYPRQTGRARRARPRVGTTVPQATEPRAMPASVSVIEQRRSAAMGRPNDEGRR
jgi:long-chain acyl-CoA synthetase